ncbi:RidA family protein [Mesorhizobium sp. M0520]|uniref:RidA family protein n=1 Tax=Mesorhizobium sp. M0520 TaxID=2956957 RepID=UPI003337F863
MSDRRPELFSPKTCPPTSGYSQVAIVAAGKLGFISGQVGIDTNWRLAPTFQGQTERAFENLKATVEACGATMADVCKLTIFLVGDLDERIYATVRDSFFAGRANMPASTLIRVVGLYSPEALIEIEAVVAIPD